MIPRTYLLTAPDAADAFGTAMQSADLLRRLREANPRLMAIQPREWAHGPNACTSLWLGTPQTPGSRMITAIRCGQIPEWTQLSPDGIVITKGWRAILDKVIKARAADRLVLERIFRTPLAHDGGSPWCSICARTGKHVRYTSASRLCDDHDEARSLAVAARRQNAHRNESR